jgi:hypothetical protein
MGQVLLFEQFVTQNAPKSTKALKDTGKYRFYRGDRYQYELLPQFLHLNGRNKKMPIADWFERTQQEDPIFYSKVQSGELAKPDIHELWRDLTARPRSKYQHVLNPEHSSL